jgi:hypothetical protein
MQYDPVALARTYEERHDEELLALHSQGTLEEGAYAILEAELARRGIQVPASREVLEQTDQVPGPTFIEVIRDHWHGRAKLWTAFWLFGVLGFGLLHVLVPLVVRGGDIIVSLPKPLIGSALVAVLLVYYVFFAVATWRCAPNSNWRVWGWLARALIVVFYGGMILALVVAPMVFT